MAQRTNSSQSSQYIGMATRTSNFTTASTSQTNITGLSVSFTVPTGGGTYKVTLFCPYLYSSNDNYAELGIWDGGTQIGWLVTRGAGGATGTSGGAAMTVATLTAGSHTINGAFSVTGGTGTFEATTTRPAFLLVERLY